MAKTIDFKTKFQQIIEQIADKYGWQIILLNETKVRSSFTEQNFSISASNSLDSYGEIYVQYRQSSSFVDLSFYLNEEDKEELQNIIGEDEADELEFCDKIYFNFEKTDREATRKITKIFTSWMRLLRGKYYLVQDSHKKIETRNFEEKLLTAINQCAWANNLELLLYEDKKKSTTFEYNHILNYSIQNPENLQSEGRIELHFIGDNNVADRVWLVLHPNEEDRQPLHDFFSSVTEVEKFVFKHELKPDSSNNENINFQLTFATWMQFLKNKYKHKY